MISFSIFIASFVFTSPPQEDGWKIFAQVKFTSKYFKDLKEYFLVPTFDNKVTAYGGKPVTLKGYCIPMDGGSANIIILSKFPYSSCFFCGGAGPESVAEIHFATRSPHVKPDQVITVTGILQLNDTDTNHLNFILKNASIVSN
jgi:hypothetical protein